jgi:hypothetical protein
MRYLSFQRIGVLVLATLLASCGASDNEETAYYVRMVNVVKDAPRLTLDVNQLPTRDLVDYLVNTPFVVPISDGTSPNIVPVDVLGNTPDGTSFTFAGIQDYEFLGGYEYTVVTAGTLADPLLFLTSTPRRKKPVTGGYLEVLHVAMNQGPLDIYLTEPGLDLTGVTPFATLSLAGTSGSLQFTLGTYQLRVTAAGSSTVIFDSGELNLVANAEWQWILVDSLDAGGPVLRMVSTAGGTSVIIDDPAMQASVRALSIDVTKGPVDVFAGVDDTTIALALDYADLSTYTDFPQGDLNFLVTLAGAPGSILLEATDPVEAAKKYTSVLGTAGDSLTRVLVPDDTRSVATSAKIRFVQGINIPGYTNVYMTTEIPAVPPTGYANAVVLNQVYGAVSLMGNKEPGEYYVSVVTRPNSESGGETLLLDPVLMQLNGGGVTTFLISQVSATDPTPVLRVINESP